jgi:hypothetical protein
VITAQLLHAAFCDAQAHPASSDLLADHIMIELDWVNKLREAWAYTEDTAWVDRVTDVALRLVQGHKGKNQRHNRYPRQAVLSLPPQQGLPCGWPCFQGLPGRAIGVFPSLLSLQRSMSH